MVANPEIAFSVFFRSSYYQQPLFLSTSNSLPLCWYSSIPGIFSPLFLYLGGRTLLALPSCFYVSRKSLHDYEENVPSHSYYTLVVSKNLTAVLKDCGS